MIGALDIGGTKIAVGMVDSSGRLLRRLEHPTAPERGPAYGLNLICEMLRQTAAEADDRLQGIGIGCTGPVDPLTGTLEKNEFLPGWEGMHLTDELSRSFGVRVAMENDADAAALGEFAWGAGRGAKRFIYVTVSTGIGGGTVFDGQLYRGADGSHPEIGHHVIDPSGPECFCGARGCWESLASGRALSQRGRRSSAREVCEAARHGEGKALDAVEQEGLYLGLGVANLITLFMPDVIALGGGVMQSLDLLRERIQTIIHTSCGLVPFEKTRLLPAVLGPDVGLIGAAQVWNTRFGYA
jgi:glucokinase